MTIKGDVKISTPNLNSPTYLEELIDRTNDTINSMDEEQLDIQRLKMQNSSMRRALKVVAKQISENRMPTADELRIVGHVILTCNVFGD